MPRPSLGGLDIVDSIPGPEDGPGSPTAGGSDIVDKHSIGNGTKDGVDTVDKCIICIGSEGGYGPDTVDSIPWLEDGPGNSSSGESDIVDKHSKGIGIENIKWWLGIPKHDTRSIGCPDTDTDESLPEEGPGSPSPGGLDTLDKNSKGTGTEDIEWWLSIPRSYTCSIGRRPDTDEKLPNPSLSITQSEGENEPYLLRGWPRFSVVQKKVIMKKKTKTKRVVAWKPESRLDCLRRLYDPIGATSSGNTKRRRLARLHNPNVSVHRPIHATRYLTLAPWSRIHQQS